jgi:hypothetical protein
MINNKKEKTLFRKRTFKFFKNQGNILFFKRHSNLFLVFFDSKKKHIITLTAGSCKLGRTRKQKVSPLNMGGLIQKLKLYLNLYKIKTLNLFIRQRIPYYLRRLKKLFKFYNISISRYSFILKKCHGFKRGRTPRRV